MNKELQIVLDELKFEPSPFKEILDCCENNWQSFFHGEMVYLDAKKDGTYELRIENLNDETIEKHQFTEQDVVDGILNALEGKSHMDDAPVAESVYEYDEEQYEMAFAKLLNLMDMDGAEFPDAVMQVAKEFGVEEQLLTDMYDKQWNESKTNESAVADASGIELKDTTIGSRKTTILRLDQDTFDSISDDLKHVTSGRNKELWKYPNTYNAGGSNWTIYVIKWDFKDEYDVFGASGDYTVGQAPSYYRTSLIKGPRIARDVFEQFLSDVEEQASYEQGWNAMDESVDKQCVYDEYCKHDLSFEQLCDKFELRPRELTKILDEFEGEVTEAMNEGDSAAMDKQLTKAYQELQGPVISKLESAIGEIKKILQKCVDSDSPKAVEGFADGKKAIQLLTDIIEMGVEDWASNKDESKPQMGTIIDGELFKLLLFDEGVKEVHQQIEAHIDSIVSQLIEMCEGKQESEPKKSKKDKKDKEEKAEESEQLDEGVEDMLMSEDRSDEDYLQYIFKINDHFSEKVKTVLSYYKDKLESNQIPSHMRDKLVTVLSNTISELLGFDANKQVSEGEQIDEVMIIPGAKDTIDNQYSKDWEQGEEPEAEIDAEEFPHKSVPVELKEGFFSGLKKSFKRSFDKGIASSAYKEDPQGFLDLIEPYVDGFEQVPFDLLRNEETDLIDRQLRLLDRPIQAAIADAGGLTAFATKLVKHGMKESKLMLDDKALIMEAYKQVLAEASELQNSVSELPQEHLEGIHLLLGVPHDVAFNPVKTQSAAYASLKTSTYADQRVVIGTDGTNSVAIGITLEDKIRAVINGDRTYVESFADLNRKIKGTPGIGKLKWFVADKHFDVISSSDKQHNRAANAKSKQSYAQKNDFRKLVGNYLSDLAAQLIPEMEALMLKAMTMDYPKEYLSTGHGWKSGKAGEIMLQARNAVDFMKKWSDADTFQRYIFSNNFDKKFGGDSGIGSYYTNQNIIKKKVSTLKGRAEMFKGLKEWVYGVKDKLEQQIEDVEHEVADEKADPYGLKS